MCSAAVRARLGRGGGEDADRARRRPARSGRASISGALDSGEEPRSTIRASGFGVMPKVRARRPRPVGDAGGAELLARHRAAEVQRRHPQAGLRGRDQPARAARLALDLDGDVDPGARVEGLGAVGVVDLAGRRGRAGSSGRRACRRRRRCAASAPARGRRSRACAPGACRRPGCGRKRSRSIASPSSR